MNSLSSPTSRRQRGRLPLLAAAMAVAASACGGSGAGDVTTYTDPDRLSYFEVPSDWNLYQPDDLSDIPTLPFTGEGGNFNLRVISSVAFDGAPSADVDNVTTALSAAEFPIGASSIRAIGEDERDFVSRLMLTQSVVPYRNFAQAEEVFKEDFQFAEDYEGVRVVAAFPDADTGDRAVVYLVSVTDPADQYLYSIAVGCSEECFTAYQDEILKVVDSWLVNINQ